MRMMLPYCGQRRARVQIYCELSLLSPSFSLSFLSPPTSKPIPKTSHTRRYLDPLFTLTSPTPPFLRTAYPIPQPYLPHSQIFSFQFDNKKIFCTGWVRLL
ncbi:hypothetical protein QYF36_016961 [Acer negundo]|nr:hypothetical protein QYF36_016961 [Acer negundo]